ncbi:hypothetical protein SNE40_023582 [Patella caerulea]|uniref:Uncharacterized protein n=1 Tax=Patella caerulea TaxID=87958 RepID=A0AAN8GFL0_PATCE
MFWPQSDESKSQAGCQETKTRNIFQSFVDRSYRNNLRHLQNDTEETVATTCHKIMSVFNNHVSAAQSFVDQSQSALQQISQVSRALLSTSMRPIECYS